MGHRIIIRMQLSRHRLYYTYLGIHGSREQIPLAHQGPFLNAGIGTKGAGSRGVGGDDKRVLYGLVALLC